MTSEERRAIARHLWNRLLRRREITDGIVRDVLPTARPASSAAARERLREMAKGGQR